MLAGYLHQGIKLVGEIKGRYLTYPEFQPLREVALDAECKRARDYVRKVRNYTAFHLDEYDETTRKTLAKLKPTMYTLMSGDDRSIGAMYFDFADYLDMTFLADEFSNGRSREETLEDIFGLIFGLTKVFLESCSTFHDALFKKLKLREHVHMGTPGTRVSLP